MSSFACRLAAAFALIMFAIPAHAEVQKIMHQCNGKLCPFFRALITAPEGWVEDKEATRYFKIVMLLPQGQDFDRAPAKIYAVARYNPKKQPLADFLPDNIRDWKERTKDAKIEQLADLARNGNPAFVRYRFEAPALEEQGYELQAVTTDTDKDGNAFIITIALSANTAEAFKAAEPAYQAILEKY
ncbi:hypothetical protein MXD81_35670 [Microbacteriaceae bacterium K1510]|nr:hypothetical protein [Microbacteriaceae bacterium K1510]